MRASRIAAWIAGWAGLVLLADALDGRPGFALAWAGFLLCSFAVLSAVERRGRRPRR